MRNSVYPENFLNQTIHHKKNDTYYRIIHLPKKYTDSSKTHKDEYYTVVERLTNNKNKTGKTTVLHINPDNIKNIEIVYNDIHKTINQELTKDFHEYINDLHYGIKKYTQKFSRWYWVKVK